MGILNLSSKPFLLKVIKYHLQFILLKIRRKDNIFLSLKLNPILNKLCHHPDVMDNDICFLNPTKKPKL